MVKILRSPPALKYYKTVYNESLGAKIKFMWNTLKKTHPTLAYFGPPVIAVTSTLTAINMYDRYHDDQVPRYYEYYIVYRPDDPRVPFIKKDDSLTYGVLNDYNTSSYEAIR